MNITTYYCEKCDKEYFKRIKPEIPCPVCGELLVRTFNTVEVGDVVPDVVVNVTNTMLYGKLPSGRDKSVF